MSYVERWTPDITDHDIVEAMIIYGGGFASRLAKLFHAADPLNQRRLKDAFPDYWKHYAEIVEVRRKQPLETK